MHFKPAWDDDNAVHESKLVEELRKRVPIVPEYKKRFIFPYGFMTYGCAKWCVRNVLQFSSLFSSLTKLPDAFYMFRHEYGLP
jgi:hypothetical protein